VCGHAGSQDLVPKHTDGCKLLAETLGKSHGSQAKLASEQETLLVFGRGYFLDNLSVLLRYTSLHAVNKAV
jgi:hypothetical protein